MSVSFRLLPVLASSALLACGSGGNPGAPPDPVDASAADVADVDAAADALIADAGADVDKASTCASTFGAALTPSFGRLDGTVVAVVQPKNPTCALPNSTHLVIQVAMGGATYRMVVDILSTQGSPDVAFFELDAPLAAGPWVEGWHTGVALDYVATLNVKSTSFVPVVTTELAAKISAEIDLGAHISVFATSGATEPHSAHLVHRNLPNADGAIVIHPDSAQPHYLLLRFPQQSF
ncbi:MAG TPA: hypothetical protein VF316_23860 [Polyangiaceae bacterium]